MNMETIIYFRNHFERERQAILKNRQNTAQFLYQQEKLGDEIDLTLGDQERALRLKLHRRESGYLDKIEGAIARMKSGDFGICSSCEEEIELPRLMARPVTTLCVACKENEEHKETGFTHRVRTLQVS